MNTSPRSNNKRRVDSVCIIGAGPSGLAVAKYLVAERQFTHIVIIEQRAAVGGLWNYTTTPSPDLNIPQTDPDVSLESPVWIDSKPVFPSPLYERLESNIPRDLMVFCDLAWPAQEQLFPPHNEVLRYLHQYAADVKHLVEFQAQVVNVRRTDCGVWSVQTRGVVDHSHTSIRLFDAVVVASGHFNVPYLPAVPGIEAWNAAYPGTIIHSQQFRRPEDYQGKRVVVVGNSASGVDIGAQIAQYCAAPLLVSQRSESFLQPGLTPTTIHKPEITGFILDDRRIRFADGSVESQIDAIVYCTGFLYSFPFLRDIRPPLIATGRDVENLYQHVFFRHEPTLAFMVLNQRIIPFPVAEAQAAVIARVWSGRIRLPSPEEMEEWEVTTRRQMPDTMCFHTLNFPEDANYINLLHDWAMTAEQESPSVSTSERQTERNSAGDCPKMTLSNVRSVPIGRVPPYWGEREYWIRQRFPAIKKAFQGCGTERQFKRSIADVGFDYEQWKREDAGRPFPAVL